MRRPRRGCSPPWDAPRPKGYGRWNGRLVAEHLGDVKAHHRLAGATAARDLPGAAALLVCFDRSGVRAQGARHRRALSGAAAQRDRPGGGREKPHIQALERAQGWLRLPNEGLDGLRARLHPPRHEHSFRSAQRGQRAGQSAPLFPPPARGVPRLHESGSGRASRRAKSMSCSTIFPPTSPRKDRRWLRAHPRVHFHFTPTHAPRGSIKSRSGSAS